MTSTIRIYLDLTHKHNRDESFVLRQPHEKDQRIGGTYTLAIICSGTPSDWLTGGCTKVLSIRMKQVTKSTAEIISFIGFS